MGKKTATAESLWSNSIVEKQNGIIGNIMVKVISDVGHGLKAALACCIISTKSSLLNSYSRKPNLLVFEGVTSRKLIASYLNVTHLARKRFIENEADKKLLKALIHKTRLSTTVTYQSGDQAF